MKTENLIALKDDMVAFIAGHGIRRINGYVTEEVPSVIFEEDNADGWKDFVEHAKASGAAFITMSDVVLEKEDVSLLLEQFQNHTSAINDDFEAEDAAELLKYVGKIGYLQLGFAYQGVMFLFEIATDWYERFQDLIETATDVGEIVADDQEL